MRAGAQLLSQDAGAGMSDSPWPLGRHHMSGRIGDPHRLRAAFASGGCLVVHKSHSERLCLPNSALCGILETKPS